MDNTGISTSNKGKTPASTNNVEAYNKETLSDEIRKLTTANVQLITDKMETKKTKVNLKADKMRLLGEKNFLIVKREELRAEIAALYAVRLFNIPIRRYQDPLLKLIRDKFKAKRLSFFDSLKKNLQKFFTKIRYYQKFYQQNLSFDSNKIQDVIVNIMKDVLK